MLSYVPDQLLADADLVNEARPEDELAGPERVFAPCEEFDALQERGSKDARGQAEVPPGGVVPVGARRCLEPSLGSVRKLTYRDNNGKRRFLLDFFDKFL